jgi:hypothetical protein
VQNDGACILQQNSSAGLPPKWLTTQSDKKCPEKYANIMLIGHVTVQTSVTFLKILVVYLD